MIKRLTYLCFLVLLLFSCKRDELIEPMNESPVLSVDFICGQEEVEMTAGVDGYYMHTYYLDGKDSSVSHGVAVFAGKLYHYDDEGTHKNLEFQIRNYKSGLVAPLDIEQVLGLVDLDFYGADIVKMHEVQFIPQFPNSTIPGSVLWDFGDGETSSEHNPVHYYNINGPDKYQVCFTINYPTCSDIICSEVVMPNAKCSSEINYTNDLFNYTYAANNIEGKPPFRYEWIFEDNIIANSKEVKFVYGPAKVLIQHARLKTTDANGCISEVAIKNPIGSVPMNACYSNFGYTYNGEISLRDDLGYNKVEIIYSDETGKKFSTYNGSQTPSNYFKILNHQDYLVNAKGLATKFLEVDFNCIAYSLDGESIALAAVSGRIAIAHP